MMIFSKNVTTRSPLDVIGHTKTSPVFAFIDEEMIVQTLFREGKEVEPQMATVAMVPTMIL
jgi:hypothetical protein